MSNEFLVWRYKSVAGGCSLKDFTGLKKKARLHEGVPLLAEFPGDVAFQMDPDFPNDILVTDSLLNSDKCLVVAERLRQALEAQAPMPVEYLPVAVIDHKGRAVKTPCSIVHPLDPVDAVDRAASQVTTSPITPGKIASFKRLIIDPQRVPPERTLFRLKDLWGVIVARRPLAEAIMGGGFSGVEFVQPEAFKS